MTPTDIRLRLFHAGYLPLPLIGKNPNVNGKDWQLKRLQTNNGEIELWASMWPDAQNTGVLCRTTPFLDIDILDPEAAAAAEALVSERFDGQYVLTRFGLPPKRAIPFQAAQPFKKVTVVLIPPNAEQIDPKLREQKIEFLCDGQQCVVDGIHPDTGKPYSWHGGVLGEVVRDDLPGIDGGAALKLVDDIVGVLVAEHGYRRKDETTRDDEPAGNGHADWGDLLDNLIDHDKLTALAMSLSRSGMSDGAAVNLLRAQVAKLKAVDPDRKQRRLDEIPDMVASAAAKLSEPQPGLPLPWINMSNWDNEPLPEQEWTVPNRIPRRQCVLFSGRGGAGKSTVNLHEACAHVLERDWLGTMPAPGPALFIDAEDEENVIHRRLAAITRHYEVTFADLIKGGLHLISLFGRDCILAVTRSGKIEPTPLFKKLLEAVGDIKPVMISIAASANVFAGSEIDRSQVQQFISLLTRLPILANGSLSLISHPSQAGISSDSGESGTTQWHNSVRARSYMKTTKPEDGEPLDTDARELVFKKNNYGPISETILLRYQNGLFLPIQGIRTLDRMAQEARAEQVFFDLLQRFAAQNRNASDKSGPSYAPALFAREDEAKRASLKGKDFEGAMRRLFAANKIWNEPYGRPSRPNYRIAKR